MINVVVLPGGIIGLLVGLKQMQLVDLKTVTRLVVGMEKRLGDDTAHSAVLREHSKLSGPWVTQETHVLQSRRDWQMHFFFKR